MNTLSRDEIKELLSAYALGALDVDERTAVEAGLAQFPELRADLAKYGAVAHGLGAGVPLRMPPPTLKGAILSQAQPQPQRHTQLTLTWWEKLLNLLSASSLLPRAAFAVLALVGGVVAAQLVRALPAGLEQVAQQQRAGAILANTGSTENVHLDGTTEEPNAWAVIRFARGERQAAMRVGHLPPLPTTQSYQLWLVNAEGKRWSGAVFNTAQTGAQLVLVNCPRPMDEIVRFGVSIEPAGGSRDPSGSGVLRS